MGREEIVSPTHATSQPPHVNGEVGGGMGSVRIAEGGAWEWV